MATFVSLVHTVFNLGLNVPWETNRSEFKSFKSIDEWSKIICSYGFEDKGERILQDKDRGARAYENLYGALRSVAMDSLYYLVDVSEISSDTDWFNDPYETRGTVSGIIIAKTDSEAQLLVYSPGINAAQTIQVTFYDSSSVEGAIRSYDSVSGFAVLSVSLESMNSEIKEKLRAADLGSSSPSVVLGRPVIAVGRPIGNSGSISYGAVTSAIANLPIQDSGFVQLTTDIYGSRNASGVLIFH
jgi:S1-C subfamily serine protease